MPVDSSVLRRQVEEYAATLFEGGCENMKVAAQADAPVGESATAGETRDSAEIIPGSTSPPVLTATLSFPTEQAKFTNDGTRAHGPVTAQSLRFEIGGRVIFAKWVEGVTATHWFDNATTQERWVAALQDAAV